MEKFLINFKVRAKNKAFWVTFIPTVILLIQVILAVFGVTIDLSAFGDRLIDVVNVLFSLLAILGVVADPTTPGVSDSETALTYTSPGVNEDIDFDEE